MKQRIHGLLAAIFLLATFSFTAARAAPATSEGAAGLQQVFESYLGKGAPGQPPARVSPAGEQYRIMLDLSALAAPLAPLGIKLTVAPYEIMAKPVDDGLWEVKGGTFPPMHIAAKSQTMTIVVEGMRFEGMFDPKIKSFVVAETSFQALKMSSQAPGMEQSRLDGPSSGSITATGTGPGAISVAMQQKVESIRQTYRLSRKKADGTSEPFMEFSFMTGAMTANATIDGLRNDSLLDLWSFAIANGARASEPQMFEQFRARIKSSLPLFESFLQSGEVVDVSVNTPMGPAKLAKFGGTVEMNGLKSDGRLRTLFRFEGLSLPPAVTNGMLPPWSKGLLPNKAQIDVTLTQYDLAVAANEILDKFQLNMPKSESDTLVKSAGMKIAPGGRVKIKIGESRITSDQLDIEFSGDVDVNIPVPRVRLVARARGIEETIKALQPYVENDKKLQQGMMGMLAAKGFGKALPDGRLEWVIEVDPAGTASVNGFKIPLPGRKN